MSNEGHRPQGSPENGEATHVPVAAKERPTGQLEPGIRLTCEQCGVEIVARNRNGIPKRFCSDGCRMKTKNQLRLQAVALLKARKQTVQRPRKASIRALDQLSAAEGLPPGCFSAGALGRVAGRAAGESTLADLLAAARRVGITEEGETLKTARAAAAQREVSA